MSISDSLLLAVRLAWNLGYIIAVPAVVFGFLGAYLDKLWGTSPLCILLGFAIALTLSTVAIMRNMHRLLPSDNGR